MGDFPSYYDNKYGRVFVDEAGKELTRQLLDAGIIREQCLLLNVFQEVPPKENIYSWCGKKKDVDGLWAAAGNQGKYPFPPLKAGAYILPAHLAAIPKLYSTLIEFDPHVIVTLGNTAMWAVVGETGINKSRGTIVGVDIGGPRQYKVLPTFSPQYILNQWEHRPIVVADFMKALRESVTPTYSRPTRELWLEPTLEDIHDFRTYLSTQPRCAVDIETWMGQITCIGFGTRDKAICIPFLDTRKKGWSYWNSAADEIAAWNLVAGILSDPLDKVFQNGVYDMQWLWVKMGITPKGNIEDTMLLHHSMQPEMQKGLAFLGSIYTNEASWKKLRPKKLTTEKKGDSEE